MVKNGEIKIVWTAKKSNQRIRKSFLVLKMIIKFKNSIEVLKDEVNDPEHRVKKKNRYTKRQKLDKHQNFHLNLGMVKDLKKLRENDTYTRILCLAELSNKC